MRLDKFIQRGIKTAIVLFIFVLIASITLEQVNNITGATIFNKEKLKIKCLTKNNVELYGTEYCSSCEIQKNMFGENFKYLNYIDCSKNLENCKEIGLTEYPTWIINNQQFNGIYSLDELIEFSGCN
jgi:hypothetical protein